jgi:hypothetical protein
MSRIAVAETNTESPDCAPIVAAAVTKPGSAALDPV